MTPPATPALGIDIGGTSVKVALLAGNSCLIARKSDVYSNPSRDRLLTAIRQTLHDLPVAPAVVGLCAPGAWDDASTSIARSANVPSIVGVNLHALVRQSISCAAPVHIFTDAHAAAFDVWSSEILQGRLLAISLGTGVGAAVLDDGQLLRVSGKSSGHMGQWDVTLESNLADAPLAPDQSRGTLEAYLGSAALIKRYSCEPEHIAPHLTINEPPISAFVRALRIAHALYRPNHVRILGGLGIRLAPMLPQIHTLVCDRLTSLARPDWTLAAGRDDHHAARGAAQLASSECPQGKYWG